MSAQVASEIKKRPWLIGLLGGLVAWATAIAGIGAVDLIVRRVLAEDLRTYLGRTAVVTAALIDADALAQINSASQDGSAEYNRAARPLQVLLANNPDYQITIESYTDNSGDASTLEQLTQDRARVLSERLAAAGVDVTRIQANGMGAANPIAPNTTLGNRAKNRRTEITLALSGAQ